MSEKELTHDEEFIKNLDKLHIEAERLVSYFTKNTTLTEHDIHTALYSRSAGFFARYHLKKET